MVSALLECCCLGLLLLVLLQPTSRYKDGQWINEFPLLVTVRLIIITDRAKIDPNPTSFFVYADSWLTHIFITQMR